MSKNKKEIIVINGDGKDLNISPVYEHIKIDDEHKDKKKKGNVIIPKKSSDKKNKN